MSGTFKGRGSLKWWKFFKSTGQVQRKIFDFNIANKFILDNKDHQVAPIAFSFCFNVKKISILKPSLDKLIAMQIFSNSIIRVRSESK